MSKVWPLLLVALAAFGVYIYADAWGVTAGTETQQGTFMLLPSDPIATISVRPTENKEPSNNAVMVWSATTLSDEPPDDGWVELIETTNGTEWRYDFILNDPNAPPVEIEWTLTLDPTVIRSGQTGINYDEGDWEFELEDFNLEKKTQPNLELVSVPGTTSFGPHFKQTLTSTEERTRYEWDLRTRSSKTSTVWLAIPQARVGTGPDDDQDGPTNGLGTFENIDGVSAELPHRGSAAQVPVSKDCLGRTECKFRVTVWIENETGRPIDVRLFMDG